MVNFIDNPLNELAHTDPSQHFIGGALLKPTTVSDTVPGEAGFVGVLPAAAREDHKHGLVTTGEAPPLSMDDVVTGILDVQFGGTGKSSVTTGSYLKGDGINPLVEVHPIPVSDGGTGLVSITAGRYLKGNGTGALVEQPVPFPVSDGGTGLTSIPVNSFIKGNGVLAPVVVPVPIPVPDGGTGRTTLVLNEFLKGNGSSGILSQIGINLSDINSNLVPFTPAWTNLVIGTGGTNTGYYLMLHEKCIFFEVHVVLGSTGSVGTLPRITIPNAGTALLIPVAGQGSVRKVGGPSIPIITEVVSAGTSVDLFYMGVVGANVERTPITAGAPFAWTNGDMIRLAILTLLV